MSLGLVPTSKLDFTMDAPLETIEGRLPGSVSGELHVDLRDLRRSQGLLKIDLDRLELYQRKRPRAEGEFGELRRNELQNAHARDWLELDPRPGAISAEAAAANRVAELKIVELSRLSSTDVLALTGAERRVTGTVAGDLRLHGRIARKTGSVELTFRFAGTTLQAVAFRSVERIPVRLDEFAVHPRDPAGVLLQGITDAIAGRFKGKLAEEALVAFELSAAPR